MVQIITDTTASLPQEVADQLGIPVIPQIVSFGEESYYEGRDIDTATFMKLLQSSPELPKTAAPPPELFAQEFDRLQPLHEPILCLHPSSELSGTTRSASIAVKGLLNIDIRVIDTRTIGSPLGSIVQIAIEMAQGGADIDEIEKRIRNLIPRGRVYFLVDTLEYLAKGGRIGGASKLLGGILKIKPILAINNGRVDQYERERTYSRAVARLKEIVLEQVPRRANAYLTIMHAGVYDKGLALAHDLAGELQLSDIPIYHVPPAIITHGGPGILAAAFFI
jgi:DegV family protein with EDD domain